MYVIVSRNKQISHWSYTETVVAESFALGHHTVFFGYL